MKLVGWINIRKKFFLALFIDILIFIFFKYLSTFYEINLFFNDFIFLFFWTFLSYICNRYSDLDNITLKNKFIRKFLNTSLTSALFLIIKFIYDFLIFKSFDPNQLKTILYFALISNFIQYYIFKILNFYSNKEVNIILIADENFLNYFKFYLNQIKSYKNHNVVLFNDKLELDGEPDEIILANSSLTEEEQNYCAKYSLKRIKIFTITKWFEFNFNRIPPKTLNIYEFHQSNFKNDNKIFQLKIKRLSDILFSLVLILFSTPILLILIILIKLEDGGPIFYSQIRAGFNGENYRIHKIRSMHIKAEANGAQWSRANDNRITKVGNFIRKTRLDELPQIVNVLKGEMSLIGPRPERPEIENELKEKISLYHLRYLIKPGISGWAQVSYPYGASIKDSEIKLSYDLFYIKNFSIWLDLLIFLKTIKVILNAKGALAKN